MIIGIPRETCPGERRVALVPGLVPSLVKAGHEVLVEADAGADAGYLDARYAERGARIMADKAALFGAAEIFFMVRGPGANPKDGRADLERLHPGQSLIGFLEPLSAVDSAREMARRGICAFALELVPRIPRAQSMDALSSMASLAGYKGVLLAAEALPRIFPMMITAAGSLGPARVFVIGAGVAGLQACATAKRLGAAVSAYDPRPVVREQVESVGAEFVEFNLETAEPADTGGGAIARSVTLYQKQQARMAGVVSGHDVVIATAAVLGKPAPVLITEAMVKLMAPGSVIVDLAAERGGNCALTAPGQVVARHGVTIIGLENLPATLPCHASQMLARNITNLFEHLTRTTGGLDFRMDDPITTGALLCRNGDIVNPMVREMAGLGVIKFRASAVDSPNEGKG